MADGYGEAVPAYVIVWWYRVVPYLTPLPVNVALVIHRLWAFVAAFRGRQDAPANPVLFAAVLTPNRSLNRGKIRLFTTLLGFIFCLGSGVFILAGAWPISGFFA